MRKLLLILLAFAFFTACENTPEKNNGKETIEEVIEKDPNIFGKEIVLDKVADSRRLPSLMETTNTLGIKLIGKVNDVCQASGCWLDMDLGDNQYIHVTFKDENFVVPKNIAGKTIVIDGIAKKELVSVEMQKKAAKSEGLSQKEIDAIASPKTEYYFEATGIIIK